MIRRFFIALQFLTVFRFWDNLDETPEDMAAIVGYFPLVGLALGGASALLYLAFASFLSPLTVGFLLVLTMALLTHGLHLDGLADTADGLFSHRAAAVKLEIMKDSRVGVFGVAALFFILTLKGLLLAETVQPGGWRIVVLFPLWGRLAVAVTACLSTYARPTGGLGRPFTDFAGKRELFLSGGTALLLSVMFMGLAGLIVTLGVALAAVLGVELWRRQVGGVTGDILGATVEIGEVLGLLIAALWI